jgi:hypothetical protein
VWIPASKRALEESEMSDNPAKQVLKDLLPHFEEIEAQNGAIIQLLKDKGIVNQEEFAKYLEQAGNASNVKWRAVMARLEYLFLPGEKSGGGDNEKKSEEKK